jgi:hypothetical protein
MVVSLIDPVVANTDQRMDAMVEASGVSVGSAVNVNVSQREHDRHGTCSHQHAFYALITLCALECEKIRRLAHKHTGERMAKRAVDRGPSNIRRQDTAQLAMHCSDLWNRAVKVRKSA